MIGIASVGATTCPAAGSGIRRRADRQRRSDKPVRPPNSNPLVGTTACPRSSRGFKPDRVPTSERPGVLATGRGRSPSTRSLPASERQPVGAAQSSALRSDRVASVGATTCRLLGSSLVVVASTLASGHTHGWYRSEALLGCPLSRALLGYGGCQRQSDNLSAAGSVPRCRFDAGKRAHPRVVPLGGAPRCPLGRWRSVQCQGGARGVVVVAQTLAGAPRQLAPGGLVVAKRWQRASPPGYVGGSSLSLRRWHAGITHGWLRREPPRRRSYGHGRGALGIRRCRSDAGKPGPTTGLLRSTLSHPPASLGL